MFGQAKQIALDTSEDIIASTITSMDIVDHLKDKNRTKVSSRRSQGRTDSHRLHRLPQTHTYINTAHSHTQPHTAILNHTQAHTNTHSESV